MKMEKNNSFGLKLFSKHPFKELPEANCKVKINKNNIRNCLSHNKH